MPGRVAGGALRFVSILEPEGPAVALVHGNRLVPILELDAGAVHDIPALLADQGALARIAEAAAVLAPDAGRLREGARLAMPLPDATRIFCVGLNYVDHAKESPYEGLPADPVLFSRFATSFVADGEALIRPENSLQLDWEGELVAILGSGGRHIPKENALEHVAGYAVGNEGSVRDWQLRTPQWMIGKNFDRSGAIGAEIVTADELPAGGRGLAIFTRVNGKTVQQANTADMIFDLATVIAFLSSCITLRAGDAILTGTPAGVGFAAKPQRFLVPGDVCEVEIEGVGVLRNTVAAEARA